MTNKLLIIVIYFLSTIFDDVVVVTSSSTTMMLSIGVVMTTASVGVFGFSFTTIVTFLGSLTAGVAGAAAVWFF